ncbi:MAG: hypothetical protein R3F53_12305 [Gammaproteobacteria bacterium]
MMPAIAFILRSPIATLGNTVKPTSIIVNAAMAGWVEEAYIAQLEKASMMIRLGMGHRDIVNENLAAYTMRPTRAEALWQLASYCRGQQRYAEGYLFAKTGKGHPLAGRCVICQKRSL